FGLIYQGGRFELKICQQGSRLTIGGPPGNTIEDVNPGLRAEDYWDGQWHVYRLHFKFPSSADAADGALGAWVDGRKVYSRTGLRADPKYANDAFYGVALGANLNQGPAEEMSLWWGRVSVWRENPGWSFLERRPCAPAFGNRRRAASPSPGSGVIAQHSTE